MDSYFAQFDKIVKSKSKTSSRVRFMIQDMIELRRRNWVPRRDENAPKTIDQIHKEVQKEEEVRTNILSKRCSSKRGGGGWVGGGDPRTDRNSPPRQCFQ